MNSFYRWGCMLLCLELSGCTGMHMYNEKRDQQGKDLKAAWAKVDLNGYFAAMREQRKKLLKADMDAISGARSAEVDSALTLLLDARIGASGQPRTFYTVLDGELAPLGDKLGSAGFKDVLDSWKRLSLQLHANRARQAAYRKLIKAEGAEAPSCPADKSSGGAEPNADAAAYLHELLKLCSAEATSVLEQNEKICQLPAGSLRKSGREAAEVEKHYALVSADADRLMAQYRRSLEEYTVAVRASKSGALASQEMSEAGAKVRKALALMVTANNVLGNEAAANERLKRIDALLLKLGDTRDPGMDATRAELAAVLVTRIADDAQLLAELNKPLVPMSLLIRRDLEKNRADLARVQADLFRKDMELLRAVQASKVDEAFQLLTARAQLDKLEHCYRDMRFLDAVALPATKTTPPCDSPKSRALLYEAAGRYSYALGEQRARTLRLEQLRRDLKREQQLAYAQANAEQWAVLIDASAGQAVEYAAAGQKASDYTHLIQSLPLLWIGRGVNK